MMKSKKDFNPPPNRQLKGSAAVILSIVSAGIIGLTAVSIAKVNSIAMNSFNSNRIALQAQSYAVSKADLVRAVKYDELVVQNRTVIGNSDFQDEVIIGNETSFPNDSNIKQRVCTINVYKGTETLPRSTLIVTRLSVSSDSGVPKGSIIPWYGSLSDIPADWSLCDGSNGTPDLTDRFLLGAGKTYTSGEIGGSNSVEIKAENLPSDGLSGFGYVVNGVDFTWRKDFGVLSGEDSDWATVHGSDSYKTVRYFSSFNSLVSQNWKSTPLDIKPAYFSVYYIMKL